LRIKFIRERANQENVIAPLVEIRNTKNKENRIFGIETYITHNIVLFNRQDQILLDQLKYFPRADHDDGPDALKMAVSAAMKEGTKFLPLNDIRDKQGRDINHPDFGRTTPEEDAWDEDDEEWKREKEEKKRRDDPNQPPPTKWLPLDP